MKTIRRTSTFFAMGSPAFVLSMMFLASCDGNQEISEEEARSRRLNRVRRKHRKWVAERDHFKNEEARQRMERAQVHAWVEQHLEQLKREANPHQKEIEFQRELQQAKIADERHRQRLLITPSPPTAEELSDQDHYEALVDDMKWEEKNR